MESHKVRVGITHGDINGIGYEIIFKTFAEPAMLELCTPVGLWLAQSGGVSPQGYRQLRDL